MSPHMLIAAAASVAARRSSHVVSQWARRAEGLSCVEGQGCFGLVGLLTSARRFASLPVHTLLAMPALSPTMSQGNLAKWHVKAGDQVSPGTVLADIETDKATLAFENQEDGYIAKLLVPEGAQNIQVGEPVAVMVEEEDDMAAFANFSAGDAATAAPVAPKPASTPTAPTSAAPAVDYPAHTRMDMPSLSPTMERGNIVKWAVSEGDELKPGDVIAEIETDKATLAFENQEEGFIAKILQPAGSRDVAVGTTIAILVEEKEHVGAFAGYRADTAGAAAAAAPPAPNAAHDAAAAAAVQPPVPAGPHNSRLGPATRILLQESGLSADQVTPTGPNGIVTKGDVLSAIAAGVKPSLAADASPTPSAPSPSAPTAATAATGATSKPPAAASAAPVSADAPRGHEDVANTQMRKVIASRLLESKVTIPALYAAIDVDLGEAMRLRKSLADQGIKVSVNDLVMKSIAGALADVPEANAYWDAAAQESKPFSDVDVCVAVATPGGLITPIVKGADKKSLREVSTDVRSLAVKARDNKLKPEEFMGGSFTVSNLGMMGVSHFSAIINPPQAAILAVGASQSKTVLGSDGALSSTSYMTATLSADHRVYDGELAARLLNAFKAKLESPSTLLL